MAKQLNVNLAMTADTSQVKAQLQDLQRQMTNLMNLNSAQKSFTLTSDLREATSAAAQLKVQLDAAINTDTGKLNLTKFHQSMKDSNMDLEKYRLALQKLGPEGDRAFASLARSVTMAEIPLRRTNKLVDELWTSLKNTARWQLSSSALHGFMGALQGAFGYAQDLNESLNNIRIVTGASIDGMEDFAKKANNAAKALSTTTTEYTNAALIYYQQGLKENDVLDRTDVTVKMANVTGQSAEVVSNQLTAIWNNFNKAGDQAEEHYANVLVALGAATASSSDEIAGGLEKFAAVADTIGLSYEYAASALATITAETRQSEDVVGTALKTIFARIQGLNLGDTLEDGTTLNKYSEALSKVGISIYDSNGELRQMDSILDEMGSKWNTLNKDQQVALAQTVAGVRQYNQLVALMDNYDTFGQNLDIANSADGALDSQANIYAQGWEGARDRVTAAAEDIYDSLIDDDFFIDANNTLADFLNAVGDIIDNMGGLKGVLLTISPILFNMFGKKIQGEIYGMVNQLKSLTSSGKAEIEGRRTEANQQLMNMHRDSASPSGPAIADAYNEQAKLQDKYIKNAEKATEEEKKRYQTLLDIQQVLIKNVELAGQKVDEAQSDFDSVDASRGFTVETGEGKNKQVKSQSVKKDDAKKIKDAQKAYMDLTKKVAEYEALLKKVSKVKITDKNIQDAKKEFKALAKSLKDIDIVQRFGPEAEKALNDFEAALKNGDSSVEDLQNALDSLFSTIDSTGLGDAEFNALAEAMRQAGIPADVVKQRMAECQNAAEGLGQSTADLTQKTNLLASATDQMGQEMEQSSQKMKLADTIMEGAQVLTSFISLANIAKATISVLSDESASSGEKVMAVLTGLSTMIPVIHGLLNTQAAAWLKNALAQGIAAKATAFLTPIIGANAAAFLAHPVMWIALIIIGVVAAIAALTAALMASSKAAQQDAEAKKHNAEEAAKAAEAAREEKARVDELAASYEELSKKYEANEMSLSELRESTYQLLDSYGMHEEAVKALSASYDELDDSIREAQKAANDKVIETANASMLSQETAFAAQLQAIGGTTIDKEDGIWTIDLVGTNGDNSDEQDALISELAGLGIDTLDGSGHISINDFANQAVTNSEEMKEILNRYMQSEDADVVETASQLLGYMGDAQQYIDEYNASSAALNDAQLSNIGLDNYSHGDIQSIEDYNTIAEQMANEALAQNLFLGEDAEEQARQWAKSYLAGADEEVAKIIQQDDLSHSLTDKITGDADEIQEFLNQVAAEDGMNVLQGLQIDEGATLEQVRNAYELAQAELNTLNLEIKMDVVSSAKNDIIQDGTVSEDNLNELKSQFGEDALDWEAFADANATEQMEMLNELTEEQIRLMNELEQASQDALREQREIDIQSRTDEIAALREEQQKLTEGNGISSAEEAKRYSEINSIIADLEEEIAELEANDIELEFTIEDTLLDQFEAKVENITSDAELLRQAAEAIGEGFIVAAEDADLLARTFPEIMHNAQVLEDGRIQLDDQVCNAIMENNAAILGSDTDVTAGQLENKIALLDAEIAYEQNKAQLLQDYLNGVISESELEDGIHQASAEYEQDLREAGLIDEAEAFAESYNNQVSSTTGALELLNAIDRKIAEISLNYSNMLSGEVVEAIDATVDGTSRPSFSSTYTQTSDIGELDNTQDDNYAKYQAQYEESIRKLEELNQTRGEYTALLSRLYSGSDSAIDAAHGAASGAGGLQDKDGGSDKEKEIKKLEDEIDRYHEIKELLEDIQTELDRIGKKKSRAWGGGKLAAINEETAALKQQLSALKQYQSQIESNLSKDKGALGQYGWSLDGNGNVSNYEANMARLVNQWNNSAQEDADKEYFENAKKALQQYEESKDLYDDVIDQITDATYALADAELEAIEYSVEIHLELDDNKLKLLEDIMETIGDSAARAVDNIEMIEKSIDTVLHQMETSKDGMKSIFDYIGLSGDVADRIMNGTASEGDQKSLAEILNSYGGAIDMDRVVQDLQQYQDNLLSYNEALRNYRDQVFETVNNAFTEHLEDFDRANDKIAHCVNLVSGYKDLIEAIGRKNIDVHGELTQKLNQALEAQAEDAHRAALAKEKYAQSAYQEALEGYQTAIETGDEYAINKWTEILETAQDELQAAKEDSQAALTEWANAIAESFSSAIQQVIDDLDTALGGLKLLREDFDMAQEVDAQYLDDYEKIYQLSKLTREVQASIDETDNVAAKKALMEYQSKINAYQQQGVQMSQYELDYLRAQYELELARIALEESQNAKSQVSMVKDAEGNYSYVYTADDEAVAEAEQTYEDRLYEMQRLNGDYINELQSNIITMQEEMSAKLEEIANNDLLSYEEKMLRMDEVRSYYLERIHFYDSQLGISIENNKELYDNEWTEYSAKTGYKISANEDYVDSWEETTLAILTNVETQEDYFDQLEQAINHATEEAENCCERAQDALNEAGMTTEELGQTISQTTDELIRDADDAANSAEQMSDEYQRAMQEIMNAATTFTSAYASMISSTIAQNQSLIASMQSVIQMALQMKAALAGASSSGGIGGGSGGGSGGSGGGGNSGQASSLAQSALTLLNEVHHGKYGTNGWIPGAKSAGYDQRVISLVLQALNDSKAGGGYDYFYDKAKQLLGFNTGGYTGNWGTSQGRLALLHQKELVLNAQDTPNILDAVGIVRDIAKAIDINALSAMVNGGLTAATFSNGKEEVLEQNVHITAEFPNATDKHEILEAFDNVINLAAQYANRKN